MTDHDATIRRLELEADTSTASQLRLRTLAMRNHLHGITTLLRSLRDNLDAQLAVPEDSPLAPTAADLLDYRARFDRAADDLRLIGWSDAQLRNQQAEANEIEEANSCNLAAIEARAAEGRA